MSATEQRATGLEERDDARRAERGARGRRKALRPVRMRRIAVVAPIDEFSAVLRAVGRDGCVDFHAGGRDPASGSAEAESLEHHLASAERRDGVAALAGWCPAERVPALTADVAAAGGSVVALPMPPLTDPPTLMRGSGRAYRSFSPLVRMYGTVPYADLDPTFLVGITYILMFGVMFGDVGHGALIVAAALLLRSGRIRALSRVRPLWPFLLGAGVAGMAAGLLYGEFFGPTGVLTALWLRPLEQPLRLIGWAVGFGVLLLA
ncbi:MAG TPA: V-type ATPase 116kDa subunit family protein, partial [Actinospica sp.]|nr:V-type ATPase 116kDa subunit family protein [Actinospica sp.]